MKKAFVILLLMSGMLRAQFPIGINKEKAIETFGAPLETYSADEGEVYRYPEFVVVFKDGQVAVVELASGEQKPPTQFSPRLRALIPLGASQEEVIKAWGPSKFVSSSEFSTILNYPDTFVVINQGCAQTIQRQPGDPHLSSDEHK